MSIGNIVILTGAGISAFLSRNVVSGRESTRAVRNKRPKIEGFAVGKIRAQLLVACILAGCSPAQSDAMADRIDAAQRASRFRRVTEWPLSEANWSRETAAMRDRAYRFCIDRYEAATTCFDAQDYSLIVANQTESNARRAVRGQTSYPPFDAIRRYPEAFDYARRYCFSIYRDAGAADARMLGPCLSVATGGDFFGIIPVP